MNIKEQLKTDFGVDLPIKGGIGNSIDNPVIIERVGVNDYVGTEYTYLKYLGMGRRIEWETVGQQLMFHKGRKIDQLKIETKQYTDDEVITQVENYYFDITECMGG